MATHDLLRAEARERPRVAIVAIAAAVLTILPTVILRISVGDQTADNQLSTALLQAEHRTAVLLSGAASALGTLAVVYVLDFLLRATRARWPEMPTYIRPVLLAGAIVLALFIAVMQAVTASRIDHFANESTLTWDELRAVRDYGAVTYIGILSQFAFAFGFILVALNAMRVGLLTRFMGYLGVFAAVMTMIPLLGLPIVQMYWLGGMAWLLLAIGKAREPPAWKTSEPVAWPSAAELREQRVRAAEARRGGRSASPAEPVEATRGEPVRRKRKKRR